MPLWVNTVSGCELHDIMTEVDVGFEFRVFIDGSTAAPPAPGPGSPAVTDKVLSRHSGIFNVAFCDGHVQSLSNSIDTNTFIHLMTPSDKDSRLRRLARPNCNVRMIRIGQTPNITIDSSWMRTISGRDETYSSRSA